MSWVYLFLAGLFEIGWPVGIKISQAPETHWLGIAIALSFMALSGYFLWLAQQNIMRYELKRSSFELWRKRVTGRSTKHAALRNKLVGCAYCPTQYKTNEKTNR